MSDDAKDEIEGLEPRELFRAALGDAGDSGAAERAAEEERRVRAEIEQRLPDLELLELLGRGGMGYVYRARQRKLEREVALKVVAPDPERQADFTERFAREAQVLARLNHPNIVAVHDYGQDGSFCWLVMEYVDGSNLRDVIRAGELEPAEALALVPKICDALQFAHDQGVVHRDVKPENILLDTDGCVKIADFGLAKLIGTPTALVTLTGSRQVLGTFRYMAPEQLDHPLEVDHRADIYSLGVVFYEMLTGEIPMGRFDPPSLRSAASLEVDGVVLRALEKEPERRYQRASEVKSDLESLERGERLAGAAGDSGPAPGKSAPKLSTRAAVSAVLSGLCLVPLLMMVAIVLLAAARNPGSIDQAAADASSVRGWSLFGMALAVPGLIGLAMLITSGVLGFRALDEIRRAWPRLYGVGAAVTGAWTGLLLVANAVLLAVPLLVSAPTLVLAAPLLLAGDIAFLFWYRHRFLQRCRTE